jgi:hypothetical protein
MVRLYVLQTIEQKRSGSVGSYITNGGHVVPYLLNLSSTRILAYRSILKECTPEKRDMAYLPNNGFIYLVIEIGILCVRLLRNKYQLPRQQ